MSSADGGGRQAPRPSRRWRLAFGAGALAVLLGVAVYLGVEKPWSTAGDKKATAGSGGGAVSTTAEVITPQTAPAVTPVAAGASSAAPPTAAASTTPTKADSSAKPGTGLIPDRFGLGGKQAVVGGGLGSAAVCTVETEAQLRAAVDGGACTFLLLTGSEYRLKAPLIITRPIVILGSPLSNPLFDGEDIVRIFHVLNGGALELRSIRTYPGQGEEMDIGGRRVQLRIGTVARVEFGGSLNMYGVSLELSPRAQTAEYFITQLRRSMTEQRITLGGYIFVAGGVFNMVGCTSFRFAPYGNPNPTDLSLGRDILLLFGTASLVGVQYISIQLWHVKLSVGGIIAVLGGTLGVYGLNILTITGFNNQFGAGLQTFIGGGNAIHNGVQRASFSLSTVRGGYGLFANGGGTFVVTGASQISASLVRAEWGTGGWSNGAGVMTLVAIQSYSCHNNGAVYGAGFHYFNGGGTFVLISGVRSNNGLTTFQSGNGFHIATTGITTVIFATSYTTAVCRYQEGLGTDTYMGGGFLTWFRVYRFRIIGLGTFIGLGNQIFVASGAGAFIDNFQDAYILAEWRSNAIINPTTGALQNIVYTVNGAGATRGQANTDIFMSVPRPGNPTGRQPIAGFPSNLRRGLGEDGNSTDAHRSLLLVEGTYVYETQAPVGAVVDPSLHVFDPLNPLASLFDTYAATAEALGEERPNQLAISTNDTDCLVCGVPADQLFGSSPCIASECPGESLIDRTQALFANAPVEVPERLASFASDVGLLPAAPSRRARRLRTRELSEEQKARAAQVKITQLEHKTTVYCRSEDGSVPTGCGDANAFKAALSSALGGGLGVSVQEEKVRAELVGYFPDGQLDRLTQSFEPEPHADGCEGWSSFVSIVTTHSEEELERAEAAWAAVTADSSVLLDQLSSTIDYEEAGLSLCAAVVTSRGSKPVASTPAEVNQLHLLSRADASFWPTVSLTGDGVYGYVTRASHGVDYEVSLSGFAALSSVKVELVDVYSGTPTQAITTIKSFPAKGGARLTWQLPAEAISGEEYVLRATGTAPQKDESLRFLVL